MLTFVVAILLAVCISDLTRASATAVLVSDLGTRTAEVREQGKIVSLESAANTDREAPWAANARRGRQLSPDGGAAKENSESREKAELVTDPGHDYVCVHLCSGRRNPLDYQGGQTRDEVERVIEERRNGVCNSFHDGQYTVPDDAYDPRCGFGARCDGTKNQFTPYGICVCKADRHCEDPNASLLQRGEAGRHHTVQWALIVF
eukprot:CAMPEP_0169190942 /NCGR_PEP_ID=MMETSP1016-20121227/4808_1 /TAXON_ID=342587 /ORGANISM="Karlodinium micrum, Strain CCMP2283" /LENGTH=203 /DNA_ID=CAMNT_0009267165 /DNA_START=94 /DNA_END=703 /DNA_ORIENTATION=+